MGWGCIRGGGGVQFRLFQRYKGVRSNVIRVGGGGKISKKKRYKGNT